MVVEIVSKEFIKPTSPTPPHLRTHMLSFLDQFLPSIYVPMVLFYMDQERSIPVAASNSRRSQLLKESLSETLTLFYPLAGRIKDHLSIDCNDEGAYYVEARVNRPLCEFLNLTDSPYVSQLLPAEPTWTATTAGGYIAMIQVTTFACGGIAIGAFLSHVIADGPAATKEATFLALLSRFVKKGKWKSRRIIFDASAIAALKAKTASSSVPDPTRVEVVSALLSKCIKATFKAKSDIQKSTLITHIVNLRQRARPQIPKHSMGNFLCLAAALVTAKETELDNLVCHLRKEIRKIDGDLIPALQGDGGLLKYCEYMKEIGKGTNDNIDIILFSSWCNFGLYEIDFGWGKPTWVTCATESNSEIGMVNTIVLMDTKMGNGVEARVFLEEQHMVMLEQNQELRAFGILDQSPLNLKVG
ncbi:acyltransferase Pun1 [Gossypium hirsutum]|uniref:Acyltransferase Pun1 n=1 Tax=Gossypium hirsutum TaxID=3635 RepID=A0A1U8KMI3_GOSHI|nr:acyltransferase Pun1-like [Gossypium hirsutum]